MAQHRQAPGQFKEEPGHDSVSATSFILDASGPEYTTKNKLLGIWYPRPTPSITPCCGSYAAYDFVSGQWPAIGNLICPDALWQKTSYVQAPKAPRVFSPLWPA